MKTLPVRLSIAAVMLIGFPLLGMTWIGQSWFSYLEFPPRTQYVDKAEFSWLAFTLILAIIIAFLIPFFTVCIKSYKKNGNGEASNRFPLWGWISLLSLLLFWIIAWTRFEILTAFQEHTFFPIWFSFIIFINALCYRRTGRCMLTHDRRYFLALFPVSALFWWFFEYLNRYVQNWHYTGVEETALRYFLLSTLAFSTVLPAVLGVKEWLLSFEWVSKGLNHPIFNAKVSFRYLPFACLIFASLSLVFIGIIPDFLFPFVWISPLLLLAALSFFFGDATAGFFRELKLQHFVVSSMLAALICGVLWEMWNYFSLVRWTYQIPFVQRFSIFEMPILGYAGYLPFGLECAFIGKAVESHFKAA